MHQLTQSLTGAKGNCFQTALACILEVDPDLLPHQTIWDVKRGLSWACSYRNVIQGYLFKHHNLGYCELSDYEFSGVQVRDPGWHVLIGPTIRTSEDHPVNHAVVGRYGEMVWDPHPSRAGLIEVEHWGLMYPMIERIRKSHESFGEVGSEAWRVFTDCLCATCALARNDDFAGLLEPEGAP